MDTATTFTASLPKRPDIVGSPEQVIRFKNFTQAMISGIENGFIAAIGTIDIGSHCLHYLFNPKLFRQFDGTVTAIIGNASDARGEFSLKKIDVDALRLFPVVNLRSAFHPSLVLGNDIPTSLLDATKYEVKMDDKGQEIPPMEPVTGSVLPIFFPIYFGQTVVYGDIRTEDVGAAFAELGVGYAAWAPTAIHAFETIDDSTHIIEHHQADKRLYFDPSWVDATSGLLAANGPCGTTIHVQSSQYPQEAQLIKSFFLPVVTPHALPTPGVITVSLPGEAEKNEEAIKGIAKLRLLHIAGILDPETGSITGVTMPTTSVGMDSVIASARSARPQAYADLLRKACTLAATLWPCNIRSTQMSLKVIQKAVASALLGGNFATQPVNSLYNDVQSVGPMVFMPQTNAAQVETIMTSEMTFRNEMIMEVSESHRTRPKTVIARLGEMKSMESFSSTCVNMDTIISGTINSEGPVPILRQVLLGFINTVNSPEWKQWYEMVGAQMPEIHLCCFGYLESIWNSLAMFATDYINCNVASENRPIGELDLKALKRVGIIYKAFQQTMLTAQATMTPVRDFPLHLKAPNREVDRKRDTASTAKPALAVTSGNAGVGTNGALPLETAMALGTQSRLKRTKRGPRTDGVAPTDTDRGLFYLKDPSMDTSKVFPPNLSQKICVNFTCKGRKCSRPRGQCSFAHPVKPGDISEQDLAAIIAHFHEMNHGWLNKHVFKDFAPVAKHESLLGDSTSFGGVVQQRTS
jgi:hypothetical protein